MHLEANLSPRITIKIGGALQFWNIQFIRKLCIQHIYEPELLEVKVIY